MKNQQLWQTCLSKTASTAEALDLYKEAAKKKGKQKKKKEKGLIHRGLGAATGTGMALGSMPVASAMLNPYHTSYHGTNLGSSDLIFNNPLDDTGFKGLSTRFAGQAGRLNEKMLANTAVKSLYDMGIDLGIDAEARIVDKALEKMRADKGTKAFNSVDAVMASAREELGKELKPGEVDKVLAGIQDNVVRAGKRIYLSTGASTVSDWAEKGTNEADIIKKIFMDPLGQAKIQGKGLFNMMTGGVGPEARQHYRNYKFNQQANKVRSSTTHDAAGGLLAALNAGKDMTDEQLKELGVDRRTFKRLQSAAEKGRLGSSIGTRLPIGDTNMLNDFPGLNFVMAANPGVKHTAADFLPNMDPSRDLSVPHDISRDTFRSLDLVDTETGAPLTRLMFDDAKTPKFSAKGFAKGLRSASPYAAMSLLGADLAQANIRNKDTYTGKAWKKLRSLRKPKSMQKTAFLSGSTKKGLEQAYDVVKGMAPTLLGATAAGVGSDMAAGYLFDKVRGTDAHKALSQSLQSQNLGMGFTPDEARVMAESGLRNQISAFPAMAGGALATLIPKKNRKALATILGAARGTHLPSEVIDHAPGVASTVLGALGGGLLVAPTAAATRGLIAEGGDLSQASPIFAGLSGTEIEEKIKENPTLATLPTIGALAAIPTLAAYGGRKYYGGHLSKFQKIYRDEIKKGISEVAGGMDREAIDRISDLDMADRFTEVVDASRGAPIDEYTKALKAAREGDRAGIDSFKASGDARKAKRLQKRLKADLMDDVNTFDITQDQLRHIEGLSPDELRAWMSEDPENRVTWSARRKYTAAG